MSDKNKTDNPYQPPAPSDEPLAKKDAVKPKARLNPVHWLLPILGYAYVPAFFIFERIAEYAWSQGQDAIARTLQEFINWYVLIIIFVLPVYVVVILLLGWRRHRQGTNTTGMKLYHGLSLILPTLLFALILNLMLTGGLQ